MAETRDLRMGNYNYGSTRCCTYLETDHSYRSPVSLFEL
jgi:hypothetical protein